MEELKLACQKFIDGTYSIEDLYRFLSWVAVPSSIDTLVSETALELERIRFTQFEENWHEEGVKIIMELLKEVNCN